MLIVLGFLAFSTLAEREVLEWREIVDERLLPDSSSFMDEDVYSC